MQDGWLLMKEFTQSFLGNVVDAPPSHLKNSNRLGDVFGPSDIILQYQEHFNTFRAQAQR